MTSPSHGTQSECAVSIVIVNWNTRDILRDCLMSISRQTRKPHEVIVVDNASSDGSVDLVRDEFPDVRLIANDTNRGFSAANNQGLEIARGDNLLLLNPDTIILDDAIDTMLDWLDQHPDVGCAGCQVLEDETTIQRTCFADPGPGNLALIEFGLHRLSRRNPLLARAEYGDWDRRSQREVDVVSGMFMLVPRHVFEAVGLLDEAFFVYSEEADWCRRIRDAGWKCVFTPTARILHLEGGGKSTAQIRSRMYVQMQKSKMIYLRKHYGLWGLFRGRMVFVGSSVLRFVMSVANQREEAAARRRLARASLRYHLTSQEPTE
ncbi:glycosyltransferase family 2 protein [Ruegeria sp. HKCCA0370]|uniref:glycosyltransferase family 2 protein n=1 Tax=Ruegeria sp. HKCCA0370 TaxID=2682995 RepID=UPI0014882330|nr:glycosyltransferase family 2 protein [Ruegeria sp. HKCCA0370]